MFKKKIGHTKFTFLVGDPLAINADALVNWTVSSLTEGDELFVRIHKEGGSLIGREILKYKTSAQTKALPMSQVLSTGAGTLPFKRIIHAILPNYRIKEEKDAKLNHLTRTLDNVFLFIESNKYDFENIRTLIITPLPLKVYGKLDPISLKFFIQVIKESALKAKVREVYIVCSEENYNTYVTEFDQQTTTRFQRFLRRFGL